MINKAGPANAMLVLAIIWGVICIIPLLFVVIRMFLVSVIAGTFLLGVIALVSWAFWTVVKDRISSKEEDHYDNIQR